MRGALQPVRAMLTLLYQATWCQFGVLHGCLYKLSGHESGHSSMSKVTPHNVLSWWHVQGGLKLDGSIYTTFHLYDCLSLSLMMWISDVIGPPGRVGAISICTCFAVMLFFLLLSPVATFLRKKYIGLPFACQSCRLEKLIDCIHEIIRTSPLLTELMTSHPGTHWGAGISANPERQSRFLTMLTVDCQLTMTIMWCGMAMEIKTLLCIR